MELKETVDLMLFDDYIDRLKAEYYQTKIRHDKLNRIIVKYEANTLEHPLDCNIELLRAQERYMLEYLFILSVRLEIEKVKI